MNDNPNNTRSERDKDRAERRSGKVTSGQVKTLKPSKTRKFANLFLDEDIESVKEYAIEDLIIPGIKDAILDILSLLLGRSPSSKSSRRSGNKYSEDYTSYSRASSSRSRYQEERRRRNRTSRDVDEILFETRLDADNVLSQLDYYARKYGQATVSDFYDACGISDSNYTNEDFGWRLEDIREAYISHVRGGCVIVLPPAVQLKD